MRRTDKLHRRPRRSSVRVEKPVSVAPTKKQDALVKAMEGVVPAEENPLSPLWLEFGVAAERDSIQRQIATFESGGIVMGPEYVTLADGSQIIWQHLYERLHHAAYTLLRQGVSITETAAHTHLRVDQVRAIANQFHLA